MRLLLLSVVTAMLAGCASGNDDDGLDVGMEWQDRSHGRMTARNMGQEDVDMRAAMAGMMMDGPNGTVPMFWGGMNGTMSPCALGEGGECGTGMHSGMGMMHGDGNMLGPGDEWTYTMHAGTWDGQWGMMVSGQGMGMMHADGHLSMMPGGYTLHMGGSTTTATLDA